MRKTKLLTICTTCVLAACAGDGLVWEYVPFQFVQLRVGARVYDGIPQNDQQNGKIYFAQENGFF